MKPLASSDYKALFLQVKERIRSAQYAALRTVNRELISLYWDLGALLSARRKGAAWGKAVVETLARDLQREFPGVGGFSSSNLWRMKVFFETYARNERLAPLVREIAWAHNIVILEKCEDDLEREFYVRWARKFGWSKNGCNPRNPSAWRPTAS